MTKRTAGNAVLLVTESWTSLSARDSVHDVERIVRELDLTQRANRHPIAHVKRSVVCKAIKRRLRREKVEIRFQTRGFGIGLGTIGCGFRNSRICTPHARSI